MSYHVLSCIDRGSVLSAIEDEIVVLEEVHDLTKRPRKLPGETYKLEWGEDSALYLTFNDRVERQVYSLWVFINTKSFYTSRLSTSPCPYDIGGNA